MANNDTPQKNDNSTGKWNQLLQYAETTANLITKKRDQIPQHVKAIANFIRKKRIQILRHGSAVILLTLGVSMSIWLAMSDKFAWATFVPMLTMVLAVFLELKWWRGRHHYVLSLLLIMSGALAGTLLIVEEEFTETILVLLVVPAVLVVYLKWNQWQQRAHHLLALFLTVSGLIAVLLLLDAWEPDWARLVLSTTVVLVVSLELNWLNNLVSHSKSFLNQALAIVAIIGLVIAVWLILKTREPLSEGLEPVVAMSILLALVIYLFALVTYLAALLIHRSQVHSVCKACWKNHRSLARALIFFVSVLAVNVWAMATRQSLPLLIILIFFLALSLLSVCCSGWSWFRDGSKQEEPHSKTLHNLVLAIAGVFGTPLTIWILATAQEKSKYEYYVSSVTLLDSESESSRLAGVYSLNQLALNYPDIYLSQVINLLSTFIRNKPHPEEKAGKKPLGNDVKEALPVIVPHDNKELKLLGGKRRYEIDLHGAYLVGADLNSTDLTGADLTGTDLTSTDLTGANLTGANLTGANLTGANLTGADLTGARGLTQEQLDAAMAQPEGSCPKLDDALDSKAGEQLVWNGECKRSSDTD